MTHDNQQDDQQHQLASGLMLVSPVCVSLCVCLCIPGDYSPDGIITPEAYLRHAGDWAAAGADIIGGCCGIGPQHLQLLASNLQAVTQ